MSLINYFFRGSEIRPHLEEIDSVVITDRDIELQHLFHQLQLGDGTLSTSIFVVIVPPSLDQASLLYLWFLEEDTEDEVVIDPAKMIDGVVAYDQYRDEMDMMSISQITSTVQPELVLPFDLFWVSTIKVAKEIQAIHVPKLLEDYSSLFEGIVNPIEGASDFVEHLFLLIFYQNLSLASTMFLLVHLWI